MTEWVAPYPTLWEINRRVALRSYAASAGNPLVRWLVRSLGARRLVRRASAEQAASVCTAGGLAVTGRQYLSS